MMTEAHARLALRNAGWLVGQRATLLVSGLFFAAVVPRLMGPEEYGHCALVFSLSTLFAVCSTLGFSEVIGRRVPELNRTSTLSDLRRLFTNLLTLRVTSAAAAAGAYLAVTTLWLRELDPVAMGAMGGAVFARAIAHYLFSFLLGLNQAARWGAGELLSRGLLLVFIVPGFAVAGFRGACLALLLTELIGLTVGLWWNRRYFAEGWRRVDLSSAAPYLRVGLLFFAANVLAMAFQSSGETLVRLVSHDYIQVGYFGLASGVYLAGSAAIQQLSMAFVAVLATLRGRGEDRLLRESVRRLVAWLAAGCTATVFAVLFLSLHVVPTVLGASYGPLTINLLPMALTLLVVSVSSAAAVVALTYDNPKATLGAAGIRLAAFWSLGPPLTAQWASLGACMAVFVAASLHAMYLCWRMREVMNPSVRAWAAAVGMGTLFLPLLLLRSSWMVDVALYAVFLAGYSSALLVTRTITVGEFIATWRAIVPGGPVRTGTRRS